MKPIEVVRVAAPEESLLDPRSPSWRLAKAREVSLSPAPVEMVASVSPYVAQGRGHGKVRALRTKLMHDGEKLCIELTWKDASGDAVVADLDRFPDAAAVLFPLVPGANPFSMGDADRPVNAWYWKADRQEPYDVIARGYSTSQRRPARASGLMAMGRHARGQWTVVFQRPLRPSGEDYVQFAPGAKTQMAFAIWDGRNAERAAQKAVSGGFLDFELAR